ncbi:dipeptidyl aminopeptidase BIII [Candidatus Phycosocius bacilliformis]|uniref:Dipeptidyl aminopeptidase BIII n=1 Tax=Candidatus Phycosocius bacilliformis TaxID=1445552 RepID=A0A2P2ECV9_9PROT|nr:dipeptidyl aminopeptidase BIII [Candidatus Phycosocius bacilliformis]
MVAKRILLAVSTFICAAGLVTAAPAQGFKPTGPALPIDVMSKDWNIRSAAISPDGKHIAAIAGIPGQNPVIRVWSTDDMSKTPTQFGSRTMRFTGFQFLNNSKLLVFANQPVAAGAYSNWQSKAAIANLDGSSFLDISNDEADPRGDDRIIGFGLFNRLPSEENVVLMEINRFSGTEIVRLNVNTGRKDRFARTGDNESFDWADSKGQIKLKSELRAANGVYTTFVYFRETNDSPWRELPGLRRTWNERYTLRPVHVSKDNSTIYVVINRDTNFTVLAKYDIATDKLSAPIAENTEFDISSASFGSASDEDALTQDPLRSFCWNGPSTECNYLDPTDKRISNLLERALPGTNISFTSRNGGANVLVTATAPNVPDTYYLLKNERQLIKIGSVLEGWDRKTLGPAEWLYYPARDGFQVPGILYLPPGYNKERDGRLPLVVMPHGGPWARDDMDFDISYWPQMFATRGFAVLMPQYRGSLGLGKAVWKGGDRQWGALMQDDKDDGAKWLVDQGIADPNRMMMYGYSYGGFAAAAAAARSGGRSAGLWQCAISGAPAIDLERISTDWGESRLQRVNQGVTVAGWDPMANLDQVKIPWLVFHGDYDRQADTIHSRSAAARMRQVNPNANFRYVEIPKMAHTLGQMTPEHRTQFLTLILDWMSNNCGNISASFKEPGLKTTASSRASK